MNRQKSTGWLDRLLVGTLSASMVLVGVPVWSAPPEKVRDGDRDKEKPVQVNRTVPEVGQHRLTPVFSSQPTEDELLRARVFDEPLVPVGGSPDRQETRALALAVQAYVRAGNPEHVGPLRGFLIRHPSSPWAASVLTNLGVVYRRTGYMTRALEALNQAWGIAKGETDARGREVANRALSELAGLLARLGRAEELSALLAEVEGRDVGGSAGQRLAQARETMWLMGHKPSEAYACGPTALRQVLASRAPDEVIPGEVTGFLATERGTSLYELQGQAEDLGVRMRMVKRDGNADLVLPAVVHWKSGHFGAIVRQKGDRYLVRDMETARWVSREALNDESSGYFLVPEGEAGAGYEDVAPLEGAKVIGRGPSYGKDGNACKACSVKEGGGPCGNGKCAMAGYSFHAMLVGLTLVDTPVGYSPPRGPDVRFTLRYVQRDSFQPQMFSYSNLGRLWTFDWLSYIEDDPANPGEMVNVYMRGGGREQYPVFNETTQSYGPERESHAMVVRTSLSPLSYERRLPDGSKEVFSLSNGSMSYPRKTFMTEWIDPQGNTVSFVYDPDLRLVAIVDAIGQVTTLSYEQQEDPWKITKVTDPFGRSAQIDYNAAGQLSKITDVIGLTSEFTYGEGDFVTALTTPYGTTKFSGGEMGFNRWLEAEDPLGGKERIEYVDWDRSVLPDSDPPELVPGPNQTPEYYDNQFLSARNTFYWSKLAMARYPGDYTKADLIHWLHNFDWHLSDQALNQYFVSGIPEARKKPLENRVWYLYEDQPPSTTYPRSPTYLGRNASPRSIARVLDDGTIQEYKYAYNAIGKVVKKTDPLGRETHFIYGSNNVPDSQPCLTSATLCGGTGIDLLEVRQVNPGAALGYDVLRTYTYNGKHQVLTATNGSGQTSVLTYLADGRNQTIVTPPRGDLGAAERTTTYSYYPENDPSGRAGRLQATTGPSSAQGSPTTTYDYDAYGRLWTVTAPDNYTATYDYDALDRVTKVTYPDGTYDETRYNRLDLEGLRDRLGRWRRRLHDGLRRIVAVRDAVGGTTQYQYGQGCAACGGAGDQVAKLIDANGNATTWEYDVQGRVTTERRADVAEWVYTYEAATSRLKTVTDAMGTVKTYAYHRDDTLESTTYAVAAGTAPTATVSYTYDSVYDRITARTDGTGTTSFGYVVVAPGTLGSGRLASVDGPLADDTVTYAYDEIGRVATRGLVGFSSSMSYDSLGRLTAQASPVGSFTYGFDGVTARPLTVIYPNGQTTSYSYLPNSGDRRLRQIKHRAPGGASISQYDYTYDAIGNIVTWGQQVGTEPAKVYTLGYDAASRLTSALVSGPSPLPVPSRFGYAYDAAGNRTAEQLDDAVMGTTHNSRNQATSRQAGGVLHFKGTVDETSMVTVDGKAAEIGADRSFRGLVDLPSGTSQVVVAATDASENTRTNTYEVSQSGPATSYSYDANGNLTSDGTKTYQWDAENRLVAVVEGPTTLASFVYNGAGQRVQKVAGGVTHSYVYDGDDLIEERVSSGAAYRYVQGPGIDRHWAMWESGGTVTYYLADHLGSVVQTTDATGAVTLAREYDPYGRLLSGTAAGGYAYTGREWDPETELYYYRARYYDPVAGRYLSEDPINLAGGDVNLYAYVAANPISFTDPSGLENVQFDVTVDPVDDPTTLCNGKPFGCVHPSVGRPVVQCDKCGNLKLAVAVLFEIIVRKDPWDLLSLPTIPKDPKVRNQATATGHEAMHAMDVGIDAIRFLREYEHNYGSEDACLEAGRQLKDRLMQEMEKSGARSQKQRD